MEFVVAPEDVEEDCYEVSAKHFADHVDKINRLIRESFEYDGTEDCGLAAYLIDDDLAEKITGIIPSVENIDGKLKKELIEQLDNGWGYDFNEDTMNIGGEDVYISFLCAKDGERFRIIDSAETINQTMGGLS